MREAFIVSGNAIKTERDRVSIHFTKERIRRAVEDFRQLDESALRQKFDLEQDSRDWKVASAKADVLAHRGPECFRPILYRPFDLRFTWYSGQSKGFIGTPGHALMRHLLAGENLGLITLRQTRRSEAGTFLVGRGLINKDAVSIFDIGTVFPLYLYGDGDRKTKGGGGTMLMSLFEPAAAYGGRRANLNPKFVEDLTQRLGLKWVPVDRGDLKKIVGPEDVFHYAYAVFHSPMYRTRYAEFLKVDFPRLPLTSDLQLFRALAGKGAELVTLHLMESPGLNDFITEFPMKGDNEVERAQYTDSDQRVWINATQYFGGVPKPVWDFHVGGYQVCEKWLKDHKARKLTYDDLQHYQKIVVALQETIRLMAETDLVIQNHGGWPIKS